MLEAAGVEFIDADGSGSGVRLRGSQQQGSRGVRHARAAIATLSAAVGASHPMLRCADIEYIDARTPRAKRNGCVGQAAAMGGGARHSMPTK